MVTSSDVAPKRKPKKAEEVIEESTQIRSDYVDPAKQLIEATKSMAEATSKLTGGKILVKMISDNMSYTTEGGKKFTKSHPFQLLDATEADLLIAVGGFRKASSQELLDYYAN